MAETPNFHSRVRIADRRGGILSELPDSTFASVAADPTANWVVPVGWLDAETLLVQVSGDADLPTLEKVQFDGSAWLTWPPGVSWNLSTHSVCPHTLIGDSGVRMAMPAR
jgi:hypothetical protein